MVKLHAVAFLSMSLVATAAMAPAAAQSKSGSTKASPAVVDGLMAPVALYPDQLLSQMLVAAGTPARVKELDAFLKANPQAKGSALQDLVKQKGFEPGLVALAIFPQVVDFMATNMEWTTEVGKAFSSDRAAVLESVQRLRFDAIKAGKLKSTDQQKVTLKDIEGGFKAIVIEPANPQVVYVPQYDIKTVYTQPPTSTTVIVQEEDDDAAEAMAAGLIGFTAGIAIGAAINNNYYYGPYGWHGAPYMYNDAWDDWYDDREDAREDWYDNREDAREDLADHREDMAETRGDRAETRSERAGNAQEQRTERQQNRTERSGTNAQASTQSASAGSASTERSRSSSSTRSTSAERSGTSSDAFSNYSSGRSERSASSRGKSSRSSSGRSGRSRR